jgi:hypothetical protein
MRRLITLTLLLLLAGGCAKVDEKKKANTLQSTIRAYESSIRWVDFDSARGFLDPDFTGETGPDPEVLKHIRVTGYKSHLVSVSEDGTEAEVVLEIRYYNEERMSEIDLTDRQTWRYDEESGRWYLMSPLPAFR